MLRPTDPSTMDPSTPNAFPTIGESARAALREPFKAKYCAPPHEAVRVNVSPVLQVIGSEAKVTRPWQWVALGAVCATLIVLALWMVIA